MHDLQKMRKYGAILETGMLPRLKVCNMRLHITNLYLFSVLSNTLLLLIYHIFGQAYM